MQFAGVLVVDQAASTWLKENLLGRRVWLKLLDHTSQAALDQKAVQCAVYVRKKVCRPTQYEDVWRYVCVLFFRAS